jgi:hypothetical protein
LIVLLYQALTVRRLRIALAFIADQAALLVGTLTRGFFIQLREIRR